MTRPRKDLLLNAIGYARNHRSGLEACLQGSNVPIDTIHIECCVRLGELGRQNWMFCWTEAAAEVVGNFQSLASTCRMQDFDPYSWLYDVLQRVVTHPAPGCGTADVTPVEGTL